MATNDQAKSPTHEEHESNGLPEKGGTAQEESAHQAAERGHVATDKYGNGRTMAELLSKQTLDTVIRLCNSTLRLSGDFAGRLIFMLSQP